MEISFHNSISHAFAGMVLAPMEQGPNLGGALVRQILTKVRVFHQSLGLKNTKFRESEEVSL